MNLGKTIITNAGNELLNEALSTGEAIYLTTMKIGTGAVTTLEEALALTDLVTFYKDTGINNKTSEDNLTKVLTIFDNALVTSTVVITEIGIYAKLGLNGTPTLFAYTNESPGTSLPPLSVGEILTVRKTLVVGITELATVNVEVAQGVYVPTTTQVIAGEGMNGGGSLSTNVTLNINKATTNALGGIIVGDNLTVDGAGRVSGNPGTTVTSTTDGITVANGKDLTLNVVNDLTNTSATKPLSANMGKFLNDTKEKKTYTSVGSLGLSAPTDTKSILKAMPSYSRFVGYESAGGTDQITDVPTSYGTLIIDKSVTNEFNLITWHNVGDARTFIRGFKNSSDIISPWVEIMTSNTPPVPVGGILVMGDASSPVDKYPGTTWGIYFQDRLAMGSSQANVGLNGGSNSKTIAVGNLPAFTVTRGTMDIIGTAGMQADIGLMIADGTYHSGAITRGNHKNNRWDGVFGTGSYDIKLQASLNWTGASSSVGSGTALEITPAYTTSVFWKRLS